MSSYLSPIRIFYIVEMIVFGWVLYCFFYSLRGLREDTDEMSSKANGPSVGSEKSLKNRLFERPFEFP